MNVALNSLFGVLSVSVAVSGLLSPPIAGLLYESLGNYRLVFVTSGIVGVKDTGSVAIGTITVSTIRVHL